jgi:SAM-dependent methyltransferase
MRECSKAVMRRLYDPVFSRLYFVGDGIDIGGGPDPLRQYVELFPLMKSCRTWDMQDGDAQYMSGVSDESFDFVHSSHCLEHMCDPEEALSNWLRILRPGGHLVCLIPDEDLYEQGVWPSTYNPDHKHTFTICKRESWSPVSKNVTSLLNRPHCEVQRVVLLNGTHRTTSGRFDQTMTPIGESAIEFVVRKR